MKLDGILCHQRLIQTTIWALIYSTKQSLCQSSGNEAFTCRWKPGSDGRLPTNYTLLYNTEGEREARECLDYISAGPNSCYFNQEFTKRWTTYNITVKAINDMGSNISDPQFVDLRYLVQPDSPTDLSLKVRQSDGIRYVWAKWSPPPWVDDSTGWQTCNYELRLKPEGGKEWEVHFVGRQTQYKMSHLLPGVKYTVQVRSVTDHYGRSKWSLASSIQVHSGQPPGKPTIIKCRSPEKETFACWWKPGSDGRLPCNYTLLYNKEGEQKYLECPDYTTAGSNSCYFDKKHTKLWITYNITVKATNEMGSSVSDPHYVDVANIVQPYPPENLTLEFEKKVYGEYLLLNWTAPSLGDVRSGWLTFEYELQIKPEEGQEWEKIFVGQRKTYKMFSVNPGQKYVAQVRCRADLGIWSEWSPKSYIKLQKVVKPKAYIQFSSCVSLLSSSMVARILPPVPGPKIKGLDAQLLEAGKTEELLSALDCQGFPPTSDYEDLLVECLEIDDSEEQQLMPNRENSLPSRNVKLVQQETDSDSGRGSCESPSLLSEKRKEARNPAFELKVPVTNEDQSNIGAKDIPETPNIDPERQLPWFSSSGSKASTWPGMQQANCQIPCHDTVGAHKTAFSAMNVKRLPIFIQCFEKYCSQHSKPTETISNGKAASLPFSAHHDQGTLWLLPPEKSTFFSTKPMDYVEVHKVNQNGMLAVLPKQKENFGKTERQPISGDTMEYTKVSTVVTNNILVLFPDPKRKVFSSFQEPPKEPIQSSQHSQAEKNLSNSPIAPSTCKIQTGGLDYMDPSNFMPVFN
uniref:Prolactin receptor n=1 Tax=Varanus komodoensis TaxID=61221 RepID=A0A8D2IYY7_VARKO